jgi:CBS domain-containing protein
MKASDAMTRDVKSVSPNQTIYEAARLMAESDAGALPVVENGQLIGVVTDRDITVRVVAENKSPNTPVREAMSKDVLSVVEDQDLLQVVTKMREHHVRRLPVVTRDMRLVGMVSIGDIARKVDVATAGEALKGVAQPGTSHSQTVPH